MCGACRTTVPTTSTLHPTTDNSGRRPQPDRPRVVTAGWGRAGYGAAPPASRVLRIAARRPWRAALDPRASTAPHRPGTTARPQACPPQPRGPTLTREGGPSTTRSSTDERRPRRHAGKQQRRGRHPNHAGKEHHHVYPDHNALAQPRPRAPDHPRGLRRAEGQPLDVLLLAPDRQGPPLRRPAQPRGPDHPHRPQRPGSPPTPRSPDDPARPAPTPATATARPRSTSGSGGSARYTGSTGTTYNLRWVVAKRERVQVVRHPRPGRLLPRRPARGPQPRRAVRRRDRAADLDAPAPSSRSAGGTGRWSTSTSSGPPSRRRRAGRLAEAMATVTMALLVAEPTKPTAKQLRSAMSRWAFVSPARKKGPPPEELAPAAAWLVKNTRPLSDLEKPATARDVLAKLAQKLDGTPAGATTAARKRMVFHNCLALAVERELLTANPLDRVRWRPPKPPRPSTPPPWSTPPRPAPCSTPSARLPGGEPLRRLLRRSSTTPAPDRPRPSPCTGTTSNGPSRTASGAGSACAAPTPTVPASGPTPGGARPASSSTGPTGTIRPVPCAPALLDLLRAHREQTAEDGPGCSAGRSAATCATRTTCASGAPPGHGARRPRRPRSGLAKTPYALRHACVSTWLAAGVDPTQVAAWAGHSVAVLLRVYAHVIDRRLGEALARVTDAMQDRPQR